MLRRERGAGAVEFALVFPVLILLVLGIVELSHLYNVQISLSGAAREAARVMAIEDDASVARSAAVSAAPSLNPALAAGQIAITPSSCEDNPGAQVQVSIDYTATLLTNILPAPISVSATGAMRCGG
ncbi:TadE/TadG family type IV pilus assembly protein [Agromyces mangrovi Wang et al. 2018]|uniref:TadE/TadG family type IV pilus assembly protein n=1 Tax=Agromyces mangrovi TaxID=1858653 RepID=UPI002572E995|nr:TadE/TadG family type IV pilus assembly protein [Agromyces mangrovi]BDZ65037.1 hypothetical protein GCM10025877_19750 [Agromyces mangrovi]